MGFLDTMKKVIGVEEIEEESITEEEVKSARDKINKENRDSRRRPYDENITEVKNNNNGNTNSNGSKSSGQPVEKRYSFTGTGTGAFKLILIEPKSFEECSKLVDNLKGRRPIIINLEKIETETARKIFDFLSGATYALNGNVQKVANNIFVFAPENVDISASQEERGFDFNSNSKSPWR